MIELAKMERVAPHDYRAHVRRSGDTCIYRFWIELIELAGEGIWLGQWDEAIHRDFWDFDDGYTGPRGAPASGTLVTRICKVMFAMERGEEVEFPVRLDRPHENP